MSKTALYHRLIRNIKKPKHAEKKPCTPTPDI